MNGKIVFIVVFLFLFIVAALLPFCVKCKQENGWMCSVCGSTKEQNQWFYLIHTTPIIKKSPLDAWLEQKGIEHSHEWQKIEETGRNLAGVPLRHSHGPAPAIYSLRKEMMEIYISNSTDEEILAFYEKMKTGSEEEQQKRIDEICDSIYKQEMNDDQVKR